MFAIVQSIISAEISYIQELVSSLLDLYNEKNHYEYARIFIKKTTEERPTQKILINRSISLKLNSY